MPGKLDIPSLEKKLRALLRTRGAIDVGTATAELDISQASFSRLVRGMDDVLKLGKARATRYVLQRNIEGVDAPIPVFQIQEEQGRRPTRLLQLHPISPTGFVVDLLVDSDGDSMDPPLRSDGLYEDLPWFLNDMRPAGFLGRLVPRQLSEKGSEESFPEDILHWGADETLRYLCRWGWNLPGNLVVGEQAMQRFVANAMSPPDLVPAADIPMRYPELASQVLEYGVPGSSAAGEQPKFLATVREPAGENQPVMVKFSPPLSNEIAERVGDLLVCEHIAHQVLDQHGQRSVQSRLLRLSSEEGEERIFLEVKRVDRVGVQHRRGLVSLLTMDNEFVGQLQGWRTTANALMAQNLISKRSERDIRWLACFGELIANTDMHLGNLSLHMSGLSPGPLAPVYDMLPMLYAPRHNQLVDRDFQPPLPRPADGDVWKAAQAAALDFWEIVGLDERITGPFRAIARENHARVEALSDAAALLPE